MASFYYNVCLIILVIIYGCHSQATNSGIDSYSIVQTKGVSSAEYQKKVAGTWTASRMRAAKPIEKIQPWLNSQKTNGTNTAPPLSKSLGSPTLIAGTLADNKTLLNRAYALNERIVTTVGKVFFQTAAGYDAACSASAVTSPSLSLVVTAAHCIYDLSTRTWSTRNWLFVPSYDDGVAPLGIWVGKYFSALTGYTGSTSSSPGWNYDVGFVVVYPSNNKKLTQVTGSLGIGFNMGYSQPTVSFGYPANIVDGEIMSNCYGKALAGKCNTRGYLGQALRCTMTQGCSGGPWVQNLNLATGLGYVTSVNSYTCGIYMLHGPYFDKNIQSLYDSVKTKV